MAKQHRMALSTGLCLTAAALNGSPHTSTVLVAGLAVMNAGIVLTVMRRMTMLSQALKQNAAAQP